MAVMKFKKDVSIEKTQNRSAFKTYIGTDENGIIKEGATITEALEITDWDLVFKGTEKADFGYNPQKVTLSDIEEDDKEVVTGFKPTISIQQRYNQSEFSQEMFTQVALADVSKTYPILIKTPIDYLKTKGKISTIGIYQLSPENFPAGKATDVASISFALNAVSEIVKGYIDSTGAFIKIGEEPTPPEPDAGEI